MTKEGLFHLGDSRISFPEGFRMAYGSPSETFHPIRVDGGQEVSHFRGEK
jgi:hypothetical protein